MTTKRRILFLLLITAVTILASLPAPQPAWSVKLCDPWCACSFRVQCWCIDQQRTTSCAECLCIH